MTVSLCSKCKQKPRVVYTTGNKHGWCRDCKNGGQKSWRKTEIGRESNRAGVARWTQSHREQDREKNKKWRLKNPLKSKIRTSRWRLVHPEQARQLSRESTNRRRAIKAGVLETIRIESSDCGVCFLPLNNSAIWPHPLSTTIGHEPPLSRIIELAVTTVIERPEHWICNHRKYNRLDSEFSR